LGLYDGIYKRDGPPQNGRCLSPRLENDDVSVTPGGFYQPSTRRCTLWQTFSGTNLPLSVHLPFFLISWCLLSRRSGILVPYRGVGPCFFSNPLFTLGRYLRVSLLLSTRFLDVFSRVLRHCSLLLDFVFYSRVLLFCLLPFSFTFARLLPPGVSGLGPTALLTRTSWLPVTIFFLPLPVTPDTTQD